MAFFKRFRLRRGERHAALQPIRRWMRTLFIFLISLGSMIGLAWLVRMPLRNDLMHEVLSFLKDKGFEVDYESVWGDLFGGVNFSSLSVVQDSDHYLTADRVHLSYRLIPLIVERRFEVRSVRIIRPRVRWLLPEEKPEEREPFDPDFNLDLADFHIRSGYVELADTLVFEDVQIDLSLKVRPHRVEGRLRRGSGLVMLRGEERLRLRSARSNFTYNAPDTIYLEDLSINTGRSNLKGDLRLAGSSHSFDIKESKLDLAELDPGGLAGFLEAEGHIGEDSTGYGGEVSVQLTDFQSGDFELADVDVDLAGSGGFFDLSLSASDPELGRLESSGRVRFTGEEVNGNLDVEKLEIYEKAGLPLSFTGQIQADYLIDTKEVDAELNMEELEFRLVPDWPMTVGGSIRATYNFDTRSGDILGILDRIRLRELLWGSCEVDASFGEDLIRLKKFLLVHGLAKIIAKGELVGDTLDGQVAIQSFQMGSLGELNPLGVTAEVDGEVKIEGTRQSPRLTGLLLARSQGDLFRTFEGEFEYFDPVNLAGYARIFISGFPGPGAEQKVDVSAEIRNGGLNLTARSGSDISLSSAGDLFVDFPQSSFQYDCNTLELAVARDTILNRFPFVVGYAADSVYISPSFFFVGEGYLGVSGSWRPGLLPRWEMSLSDIDLETVSRILGLPEIGSGILWGQITSREESKDGGRTILIDLGGSDFKLSEFQADSLLISGVLDTAKLDFNAELVRGQERSTMTGYTYYDLADSMIVKNFDIQFSAQNIGVWVLNIFLKDILEVRKGRVSGDLHVSGSLPAPNLSGWVYVRDAEMYVPVVALNAQSAEADILFAGGKVIVDRLDAEMIYEEGTGHLEGRGDYVLFEYPYPFHFGLKFSDALYNPERRLRAIAGGKLYIDGTASSPLWITGEIDIKQALINYGLGDEIRVTAPDAPMPEPGGYVPPTYIDLTVTGQRNIWISNRDMYAEVVPDLKISLRDEINPRITGIMTVRRGFFYYFDHQLRLDASRSRITFPPIQELNPEFDIWASKLTNEVVQTGATPERVKIIIHLGGTLYEPILEFYSEPPVWSESEILFHLNTTLGGAYLVKLLTPTPGQGGLVDLIEVEDFGVTGGVPTKVTFGKYINDRLFASYTYALSEDPGNPNRHQFMVEYDIDTTKHNQHIILERDEEGAHSLRYQIKLRY